MLLKILPFALYVVLCQHRLCKADHVYLKHCSSVAVQLYLWEHVGLRSRYSALVYLLIKNLLPSNGCCSVVCFVAIA
jgi:hypothetical protein